VTVRAAPWVLLACALALASTAWSGLARGQSLPDPAYPDLRPELARLVCPVRERPYASEAERLRFEMRARYAVFMPRFLAKVGAEVDAALLMPVDGVRVAQVSDTWGAARAGGRSHEGVDIFAPTGTPIRSAVVGFVYSIESLSLGGNSVTIVGGGGRRYFYTHLSAFAEDLREGQHVTTDTVLGYVGNTGDAATTPPHLHFGVYEGAAEPCRWRAINPYPLLLDR
jgi:murein DD-endopeptidase MepM/ murein hydrolase activator NlpD